MFSHYDLHSIFYFISFHAHCYHELAQLCTVKGFGKNVCDVTSVHVSLHFTCKTDLYNVLNTTLITNMLGALSSNDNPGG